MTRVGYLVFNSDGAQDYCGAVDSSFLDYDNLKRLTSNNTGNLMFKYAARRLFLQEVKYIKYSDNTDKIREQIDVLILPEANLINPKVNYGKQANFIREINKPTLLLGVGAQAQASVRVEEFPDIPNGTIDFLSEVSKRTPNILCRGYFTKQILESLGIFNVKAVGCPTYMINPSPRLWTEIITKPQANVLNKLTVTEGVYPTVKRTEGIDYLERFLFDHVLYAGADYVAQCQISVLKYGFGMYDEIDLKNVKNLKTYLAKHVKTEFFIDSLSCQSKAFCRVDNWLNYAKSRSAFCGTRIHGNMVGIQSGTPSLPIAHDSRTEELCEIMKLPHITPDFFLKIKNKSDLVDAFDILYKINPNELNDHRANISNIYISNLYELGLTPSKVLESISSF